jgi:cellulose 1,4-beta-cellobiosidase
MDIWEANSMAAAYTPHPCSVNSQTRCTGADCGQGSDRYNGVCDPDGCDFNSFRMGDTTFLGKGKTVDTTKKFTIVTQFISSDGTANGNLAEIRRFYVQNGKIIPNSVSKISGIDAVNSITDNFCAQQKTAFGDNNRFAAKGGLKQMGAALKSGMVLALSLWDDHAASMLWLDSDYPTTADPSSPGVARGTCPTTSGNPKDIESQNGSASVTYSNIKWGDLNTTFTGSTTSNPTGPSSSPSSSSSSQPVQTGGTVAQWGQCGGQGYTGPTTCASPYTCHVSNPCEYLVS